MKSAEGIAVGAMAGGMVLLSTIDAMLTTQIVAHGGGTELNPLMRHLLDNSLLAFWLLKIFGSGIAAYILVRMYQRLPKVACFAFGCCLTALAGIVVWNLFQI